MAGASHTLIAESGLELLRQASRGSPREASRILNTALHLAVPRALNHLPDEILQQAIEELRLRRRDTHCAPRHPSAYIPAHWSPRQALAAFERLESMQQAPWAR